MKLSVIVPIYNVEPYLRRCLDSILNQTYHVDEIICVDDGSTDNSLLIAEEYAARFNNIKVIHKSNGGLVSARKAGLQIAQGKYISYVDSDDWIEGNMYEEMLKAIIENEADLVTSGCIRDYGSHLFYEEEGIKPGTYRGAVLEKELKERIIETENFFKSNLSMHVVNKIFVKNKLLEKQLIIDDEINIGEDSACAYPYILDSEKVVVMGKSYYHYCIRDNSIMGKPGLDEYQKGKKLKKHLCEEFMKHTNIYNIAEQCQILIKYWGLLQYAPNEIEYKNNQLIPYGVIERNDRIVIYGAGKFGIELKQILDDNNLKVVAWIDKKKKEGTRQIDYLRTIEFDKVLIAVLVADVAIAIRKELSNFGIEEKKIMSINSKLLF